MKKLRIGIIGVGKLGEIHVKLLKELVSERSDIEFAGIFDTNSERMNTVAVAYKVKSNSSLMDFAKSCDAAIIATSTSFHFDIAKELITQGIHLFIEKPITATIDQADHLIALEKKHHIKIQVGHIERFNPALLSAEPYLQNPVFIAAERLSGFSKRVTDVSVVLDLMIHDIDLILALVNSSVKSVSASGASVFSNELDIANARLEFENGTVATVTASRISRSKVRKMRFFCNNPNSYISLDLGSGKAEIFRLVSEASKRKKSLKEYAIKKIVDLFGDIQDALDGKTIEYISPEPSKINALKEEQKSFINSIVNNNPIRVNSIAGRRALDVAERITKEIVSRIP